MSRMRTIVVSQHHASVVQLAHLPTSGEWTLLAIDLAAAVSRTGATFSSVRRLQLCAHMHVRGAYTSDLVYSAKVHTKPRASENPCLNGFVPIDSSHCAPFIPRKPVPVVNIYNHKNLLDPKPPHGCIPDLGSYYSNIQIHLEQVLLYKQVSPVHVGLHICMVINTPPRPFVVQRLPSDLHICQTAAVLPVCLEWLPKQPYVITHDDITSPRCFYACL